MRFKKSDRIQSETYLAVGDFLNDVIETVLDEDNFERSANIISDRNMTEYILETIEESQLDFKFEIQLIDFRDDIDEYMITILDDGEVYAEPAVNKDGEYFDLDGFLFVHKGIGSDVYNGNNRRCDTMVFTL